MSTYKKITLSLLTIICVTWVATGCDNDNNNSDLSLGATIRASISQISEATNEIRKTAPAAIIVWAGGRMLDGSTMADPQETDTWDFQAVDMTNEETPSWNLKLSNNVWEVTQPPHPPLGITYTDLTGVWMDATAAWELVKQAGITEELKTWELYQEVNPSFPNPLFLIVLASGRKIFVDSVTGDVFFESLVNAPLGSSSSNVLTMITLANEKAKLLDPDAIIIRASGMDLSGQFLSTPEQTTSWDFIAHTNTTQKNWQIHFSRNSWYSQELSNYPLDMQPVDLTSISMTGQTAWDSAMAATTIRGIISWDAFKPLSGYSDIIYAFLDSATADYVLVNSKTGEVTTSPSIP